MSEINDSTEQGVLRRTIAMVLYNRVDYGENERNPMQRSVELAEHILFAICQSHSFRCKDCKLEHLIDSNGNWRALKPN